MEQFVKEFTSTSNAGNSALRANGPELQVTAVAELSAVELCLVGGGLVSPSFA